MTIAAELVGGSDLRLRRAPASKRWALALQRPPWAWACLAVTVAGG